MALPWTDLINQIGQTVRQVIPNPEAQREFDLKIMELAAEAEARENELMLGQVEVNKTEATHANLFVAGWRPFIGWTGGFAFVYAFILSPLLEQLFGLRAPELDLGDLIMVVTAMLGIGGMRTFEKTRGVATSVNGKVPVPVAPRELPKDLEGIV